MRGRALGRFPGEQSLRADACGLIEEVAAGARDDRQARDPLGPAIEHERLARGQRVRAVAELVGREPVPGQLAMKPIG